MRIVVVLPEPFGPSRPNTSPRWISRSSESTATNVPNVLRSFSARTATSSAAGAVISPGRGRIAHGHRQPGLERRRRIAELHFHAEHQVRALVARQRHARRELGAIVHRRPPCRGTAGRAARRATPSAVSPMWIRGSATSIDVDPHVRPRLTSPIVIPETPGASTSPGSTWRLNTVPRHRRREHEVARRRLDAGERRLLRRRHLRRAPRRSPPDARLRARDAAARAPRRALAADARGGARRVELLLAHRSRAGERRESLEVFAPCAAPRPRRRARAASACVDLRRARTGEQVAQLRFRRGDAPRAARRSPTAASTASA